MKLSLISLPLLASMAGLTNAWSITIYENNNCNRNPTRYYAVDGSGQFDITPWNGSPFGGTIDYCGFYTNGGSTHVGCTNRVSSFVPRSFVLHIGSCEAYSGSTRTQIFQRAPACNTRDDRAWGHFRCRG